MIWKSYTFDWQAVNKTTADFQIWLTLVNWRKLSTRDEQTLLQGVHGVSSSPTLANARAIEIEGEIMADTRVWLSKAMDFLDGLFALQSRWFETEYKKFTVIDEQDREFWLDVKIKQVIDYEIDDDDYMDGADRRFRVVLQWDDPRFFETIENEVSWSEWNYGGAKMWFKLWTQFNQFSNEVTVIATWNIWSPCRFEIKAIGEINAPLKIVNLDNNRILWIDEDFAIDDVVIIDTWKYTITKNGENIKASRMAWSSWLQIDWTTRFWFTDVDGIVNWNDLEIKIYFSNVLL